MRAAVVTTYGGPEVLEIRTVPDPVPGKGQILVRVRAFGLNFADILGRFGVYPGIPQPPFIPGLEFCGDVAGLGPGTTRFAVGDRVMGYSRIGSHAEFLAVDGDMVTHVPSSMSDAEGAAFLVTSLTAYHGMVRLANLRKGEKLLVHAAAGGVGLAAVQLGRHIGAEVFGTAGTDEKVSFALSHGAHHVINYDTGDFAAEVRRLTHGGGVDVVMDSVGGVVFKESWRLLAGMGRYVLFGISAITGKGALNRLKVLKTFASMMPVFPQSLLTPNKGIFGFNLGTLTGKADYLREATAEIVGLYERRILTPVVGRTFPFGQVVEAHRYLQTRKSIGKVVVSMA